MTPNHAQPAELDSDGEPAPDSGRRRVSGNTAYESGIPPARERLAREADAALESLEHLELVMVESTRAEANLGLLMRGLAHLSAGAAAARDANAALSNELIALREKLAKTYESESELAQRVEMLTQMLEAQRRETERERQLWFAQEDAFLIELMTDYERKLEQLMDEHERQSNALSRALQEAQTQRDLARTELVRITFERDAALAALNEPSPPTVPMPSLPPESAASAPSEAPPPAKSGSAPLEIGVLKLRKSAPMPASSGYSMGGEEIAEERLEGVALARKPED